MARYDKYDPYDGGFRAPLAADTPKNSGGNPIGVGINAQGRVVAGAGTSGVTGLMVLTRDMKAGEVVDVMTDGEIVEFTGAAGSAYYANTTTGVLSTTAPGAGVNGVRVGHTVEATRLVVRVQQVQG